MTAPLLVLRVGYMERYDGRGSITAGGAYVTNNGFGGEVLNFKPSRGMYYDYAMTRSFAGVNLRRLNDSRPWSSGDEMTGVDVVFIAKRPDGGQVVVGWYRNATVFHQQYRARRGGIPSPSSIEGVSTSGEFIQRTYLCLARAENAILLPECARTFKVPAAAAGNKGFPGQSNVWYPSNHSDEPRVKAFAQRLRRYMGTFGAQIQGEDEEGELIKGGSKGGGGRVGRPDATHNATVEKAATNAVVASMEKKGYVVVSVESENKGWDLEATKGKTTLYVEVKGTAGADIAFELIPNEYKRLREHPKRYRVCMVCDALRVPRVFELRPNKRSDRWELRGAERKVCVPLIERTGAFGAEAPQKKLA